MDELQTNGASGEPDEPPKKSKRPPSFEESLALERNPLVADFELPTKTSLARRKVLRGEWFRFDSLAAEIGKPDKAGVSLVNQCVAIMRHLGFRFEKRTSKAADAPKGSLEYRLTNPRYTPSKAKIEEHRASTSKARRKQAADESKRAVDAATPGPATAVELAAPTNGHDSNGSTGFLPDVPFDLDRLPRLGEPVYFAGLALDEDDGSVRAMLRSERGAWTVALEGMTTAS